MDRLAELDAELTRILDEIAFEVERRGARDLAAPVAWLYEARGWLQYELGRSRSADAGTAVPFTYIPLELRRS